MSDKQDETEPQGTPSEDPQGSRSTEDPQGSNDQQQTDPQGSPQKSDVDWQQEARKWEQQAKKAFHKADQMREQVKRLVDPDEAQQQVKSVEDQLTAVTQERDTLQTEVLRLRVALEAGLSPDLAKRLVGATEDELKADAEVLAEFRKPTVGTPHARTGAGENGQPPAAFDARAVAESAAARSRF